MKPCVFWLTHDTTDYVDWSKAEFSNRNRAAHLVPVTIPASEYGELSNIAENKKKIACRYDRLANSMRIEIASRKSISAFVIFT